MKYTVTLKIDQRMEPAGTRAEKIASRKKYIQKQVGDTVRELVRDIGFHVLGDTDRHIFVVEATPEQVKACQAHPKIRSIVPDQEITL